MSVRITLDTPVDGIADIEIETPLRVCHLVPLAMHAKNPLLGVCFLVSAASGCPVESLLKLTVEDWVKVQEVVNPLLAPFTRLQQGTAS